MKDSPVYRKKRSLAFRLFFIYFTALVVLILIFVRGIFWLSDNSVNRQLETLIQADSDALVEFYKQGGPEIFASLLRDRVKKLYTNQVVYLLVDGKFDTILGNIPKWPDNISRATLWGEIEWQQPDDNRLELLYHHRPLPDGNRLLVGRANVDVENLENQGLVALVLMLLATTVIGGLGGWLLHVQIKSRFQRIEETCDQIAQGNLKERMTVGQSGDEIDHMAFTLNTMLDRIDDLMKGIEQVTNNIAHDLRTPLTRLRARLDQLSKNQNLSVETEDGLFSAIDEVDNLLSIFKSLLDINRIEMGQKSKDFELIDLNGLFSNLLELYEVIAEEKQQSIHVEIPKCSVVEGNRNLLLQCFANLIDNAIKYSPEGSKVEITCHINQEKVELIIKDMGPGIPVLEHAKVFDRFYRVEQSRNQSGNGLGLSLVLAVVSLHNGVITLRNDSGLVVSLELPITNHT